MSYGKPTALVVAVILGLFGVSFEPAAASGVEAIGDTLWSFRSPVEWPSGLAWGGGHFWLGDIESDSLYRLSDSGVVEAVFRLPDSARSPAGMTFIGDNLWMVDENTARLFELDTATMQPRRTFRLPDSVHSDATSWGLAWDGSHLWHSQYAWGEIFQLDTTDGSVVSSFAPPDSWIMSIEYDGQYLWGVSTQTNRAYVMSLPSGAVVQTYSWQVPYSLGMTLVDGYMWCASTKPPMGTRRVYKVDIGQGGLAELPGARPLRRLAVAFPNPFRGSTTIRLGVLQERTGRVTVVDAAGRVVRALSVGHGASSVKWDGRDQAGRCVNAGVYFVRVKAALGESAARIVLLP